MLDNTNIAVSDYFSQSKVIVLEITPAKVNMSPPERNHVKRKFHLNQPQVFRGHSLVFRGVVKVPCFSLGPPSLRVPPNKN